MPLILKDNLDTADLPTTGGSVTLRNMTPAADAFVVARLREAGAIVVGKANLTELAYGGTSVSSLGGQTLNPYDLRRTPGGSSGGTGAAIAASYGVLGVGSDTGQSVRSPASACSLVGVRPTRGLVSRRGLMPFSPTQDEVGPITRTVEDAARMLDVMAGHDPSDPITARGIGHVPASYAEALSARALAGARIGLLTPFLGTRQLHSPVNDVVRLAVGQLMRLGAMVMPIGVPGLDALTRDLSLMSLEFADAFRTYMAGPGRPRAGEDAGGTGECGSVPPLAAAGASGGCPGRGRPPERRLPDPARPTETTFARPCCRRWTSSASMPSCIRTSGGWSRRWARSSWSATGCCRTAPGCRPWCFRADSRRRAPRRRWGCRSDSSSWAATGARPGCCRWPMRSSATPGRASVHPALTRDTIAKVRLSLTLDSMNGSATRRNLSRVPIGATAVVSRVSGARTVVRRLLEMGLVPGTPVTVQREAPLGDPVELRVRNYALSIRRADALGIEVE